MFKKFINLFFYIKHCFNYGKIAGPGILGFKGGVFNPGALNINGNLFLLAKAQVAHWIYIRKKDSDIYLKGAPVLISLDDSIKPKEVQLIKTENFPSDRKAGLEDFRMFIHKENIFVNHGVLVIDEKGEIPKYHKAIQTLSVLDLKTKTLNFSGYPALDFKTNQIEKNWLYWSNGDDLYLFYSFSPYRVLKLKSKENWSFSTIIDTPQPDGLLKDPGGYGTFVSFSTNPVSYDETSLLILIHQYKLVGHDRFYHHWGVLISKEDFRVLKITSKSILSGKKVRGKMPGVLYTTSVIKQQDRFVFFSGEADAYISSKSISISELEKMWVTISSDSEKFAETLN